MIKVTARAKVNYCLHVIGKRDDGYHELDSLVMFADFGDDISLAPSEHFKVSFHGMFSDGLDVRKNSIIDAVKWFEKFANVEVHQNISIEKNIPVMAGLGGGTADAAAVIHALCDIYNVKKPDPSELAILGADVPISFFGSSARMRGIGEQLDIWAHDGFEILLVNPREAVETRKVFGSPQLTFSSHVKSDEWIQTSNDMEAAACALCPKIVDIKQALKKFGADKIRMTGSGSTVFAIGKDLGELSKKMRLHHPEYWSKHSVVKPSVQPPDHKVQSTFL